MLKCLGASAHWWRAFCVPVFYKDLTSKIMKTKKMIKTTVFGFLVLFIILIAVAVNSDPEEGNSQIVRSNRCLEVTPELTQRIKSGLKSEYEELSISDIRAVKSEDFSSVYFVSMNTEYGPLTLSINDLTKSGIIFSVGNSDEYFSWPSGENSSANLSVFDDGVGESRDCI